jgi:hypothetical protein
VQHGSCGGIISSSKGPQPSKKPRQADTAALINEWVTPRASTTGVRSGLQLRQLPRRQAQSRAGYRESSIICLAPLDLRSSRECSAHRPEPFLFGRGSANRRRPGKPLWAFRKFHRRDRPLSIVALDRDAQAMQFIKVDSIDRTGLAIGQDYGLAD